MQNVLQVFHNFANGCTEHPFLGLPTWYHYLVAAGKMQSNGTTGGCEFVKGFTFPDLSLIGLAVIDILLRLSAIVAVGYIIYGGVLFITAQGEPDKVKRAQGTIFNSLIGLGICIASVGAVSFIGKAIT